MRTGVVSCQNPAHFHLMLPVSGWCNTVWHNVLQCTNSALRPRHQRQFRRGANGGTLCRFPEPAMERTSPDSSKFPRLGRKYCPRNARDINVQALCVADFARTYEYSYACSTHVVCAITIEMPAQSNKGEDTFGLTTGSGRRIQLARETVMRAQAYCGDLDGVDSALGHLQITSQEHGAVNAWLATWSKGLEPYRKSKSRTAEPAAAGVSAWGITPLRSHDFSSEDAEQPQS